MDDSDWEELAKEVDLAFVLSICDPPASRARRDPSSLYKVGNGVSSGGVSEGDDAELEVEVGEFCNS